MNRLMTLLYSLGIGAGLMYFYDPSRGNRRRAVLRDQVNSFRNQANDSVDVAVRDLRNRTRGVLAEAMGRLSDEGAPDWLLEERVRAELGRIIHSPRSIDVSADGGRISLHGPVLAEEADYLVKRVAAVRGVKGVDNQLDVHQTAEDIPGLQGQPNMRRILPEWEQETWSPAMRLVSGVTGGLLAVYGLTRRGLMGTILGTAGLGLAARGVANLDLKSLFGMSSTRDAITINKAVNIDAPVEQLYEFWSNFENLPRFMAHLRQVKDQGNGRSHWIAIGPAGMDVEWDAIVTRQVPNQLISWESVAGSPVKTTGFVRFDPNPEGGARVTVKLGYTPPAGALGHAVASLFGTNPKQAMNEDLARLKTLFETGKTTVEGREMRSEGMTGASA